MDVLWRNSKDFLMGSFSGEVWSSWSGAHSTGGFGRLEANGRPGLRFKEKAGPNICLKLQWKQAYLLKAVSQNHLVWSVEHIIWIWSSAVFWDWYYYFSCNAYEKKQRLEKLLRLLQTAKPDINPRPLGQCVPSLVGRMTWLDVC